MDVTRTHSDQTIGTQETLTTLHHRRSALHTLSAATNRWDPAGTLGCDFTSPCFLTTNGDDNTTTAPVTLAPVSVITGTPTTAASITASSSSNNGTNCTDERQNSSPSPMSTNYAPFPVDDPSGITDAVTSTAACHPALIAKATAVLLSSVSGSFPHSSSTQGMDCILPNGLPTQPSPLSWLPQISTALTGCTENSELGMHLRNLTASADVAATSVSTDDTITTTLTNAETSVVSKGPERSRHSRRTDLKRDSLRTALSPSSFLCSAEDKSESAVTPVKLKKDTVFSESGKSELLSRVGAKITLFDCVRFPAKNITKISIPCSVHHSISRSRLVRSSCFKF